MDCAARLTNDLALMSSERFTDLRRMSPGAFTRKRKMPADQLVRSVIARKGRTLEMELREFSKATDSNAISVPGYLKAREKLNPLALRELARHHASSVYADGGYSTAKGIIVIAIDGSTADVPTNDETIACYGNASGRGRGQAMMGLSCAYDVINRQIVDLTVNRGGFDERAQIPAHIDAVRDVTDGAPIMLVMDRGYPSFALMAWLEDHGIPYLMRCQKNFMSAEFRAAEVAGGDAEADVEFTHARLQGVRGLNGDSCEKLRGHAPLKARCVLVDAGAEQPEKLVTSIPADQMTPGDLAELYHARWGIETCFQMLKDRLQMENMTGTKPILIEQDVFAAAYLFNVAFDMANEADPTAGRRHGPYRHEMTVNKSFAIGVLKDELMGLVLASQDEREARMAAIVDELPRSLVPIRRKRTYSRDGLKRNRANRYSNTHKRVF